MTADRPPPSHPSVNRATVSALVRSQHPDLAHLELGGLHEGFDMAMFPLGETLAVRLPRTADGAGALAAETALVPQLSEAWTFPFPRVVRTGEPGEGYPWAWSVVQWLEGGLAAHEPLADSEGAAVGEALAQIHQPAPAHARFNVEQSVELAARDESARAYLQRLTGVAGARGEQANVRVASRMWEQALSADPGPERVWSHADLHGSNVLSARGAFAGIIDWGDISGCDPAVDLGFLVTLMPAGGVAHAWERYAALTGRGSAALEARARGIGLWKSAQLALVDEPTVSAMGWRGLQALGVAV